MAPLQSAPDGSPFFGASQATDPIERFATDPALDSLLLQLAAGFGRRHWWPAESAFEVIVGAVLTQNTAWTNVELALCNLRGAAKFDPAAMLAMATGEDNPASLEAMIRPSGAFRQKAKKLRATCTWLQSIGGVPALETRPLEPLRDELLGVFGIGPETADSILCYAAGRKTAVVDAYARRVLGRHGLLPDAKTAKYETVRSYLIQNLVPDLLVMQEAHALFVAAGYDNCKPTPHCCGCPAPTPDTLNIHV